MQGRSILEKAKEKLVKIVDSNDLLNERISILVKTLTPEEAIGNPGRRDFPIIAGKERVIEAEFLGVKSHVFTDSPGEFIGTIQDIMRAGLETNKERALFVAALNVIMKKLGMIDNTIHCRDEEPEQCATEIKNYILEKWGKVSIGLIGLNPALAEAFSRTFGASNLRITDLDKKNINEEKFGVEVWDGRKYTERLVKESDVVVLTGTTLVNGSFDEIFSLIEKFNKKYLIYGVTTAGISQLFGLERVCFFGRPN
jgi:hypothetical protein